MAESAVTITERKMQGISNAVLYESVTALTPKREASTVSRRKPVTLATIVKTMTTSIDFESDFTLSFVSFSFNMRHL